MRRARLRHLDPYAGGKHAHRKAWIVERLGFLSSIFAIDICAYAVMSDHYRLVLHVDRERIGGWSSDEIIERWSHVYRVPSFSQQWLLGAAGAAQAELASEIIEGWRGRLANVDWFMRSLNEYLAHRANAEEHRTAQCWKISFKTRPLLDAPEGPRAIDSESKNALIAHGCFAPLALARPLPHSPRANAPRTHASMLLPSGSRTNAP